MLSLFHFFYSPRIAENPLPCQYVSKEKGWDKSPGLSIVFRLSSKTQWLSGLYYADFISFYSPTQLCGGGTTKSNSNELPISVPLSFLFILLRALLLWFVFGVFCRIDKRGFHKSQQNLSRSKSTHSNQSDAQSFQEPNL